MIDIAKKLIEEFLLYNPAKWTLHVERIYELFIYIKKYLIFMHIGSESDVVDSVLLLCAAWVLLPPREINIFL